MRTRVSNFIVETHITDLPSGLSQLELTVRRLVETGLPLSAEEQDDLRHIEDVLDQFDEKFGGKAVAMDAVVLS